MEINDWFDDDREYFYVEIEGQAVVLPRPDMATYTEALFERGELLITYGAMAICARHHKDPHEYLDRHLRGDWGDLGEEDKAENQLSLEEGFRLLSRYNLSPEDALYVITEWNRVATTILDIWEY